MVDLARANQGDQPRRRTLTVGHDGESLYVEVLGEGGVPLVLSHGLGGNHAVWMHQAAHFARDRTVVLWDHRGFGRSTDHADRTSPTVAAADLLAILDRLAIERADLAGQSMGGWTSLGAALARPRMVRALVLADSLGGLTSAAVSAAMHTRPPTAEIPERLGSHPAIDPSLAERDPARALLYQQLGGMGTMDPSVVMPRLLGTTHDQADADRLTMPVLCIVGDRDPLFPVAAVRAAADMLPDARVVEIAGSGHSPYFEDPDAWNDAVSRFLESLER
ncbi:alpha/beta fold hydrolase [Ilumatobacter sp.]|uniref:alpha/beta fold hydrolase n=1 Tax=Ilumatobacter sp. TaxID=1967498 RepID=UPI003AF8CFFD